LKLAPTMIGGGRGGRRNDGNVCRLSRGLEKPENCFSGKERERLGKGKNDLIRGKEGQVGGQENGPMKVEGVWWDWL